MHACYAIHGRPYGVNYDAWNMILFIKLPKNSEFDCTYYFWLQVTFRAEKANNLAAHNHDNRSKTTTMTMTKMMIMTVITINL